MPLLKGEGDRFSGGEVNTSNLKSSEKIKNRPEEIRALVTVKNQLCIISEIASRILS